MTRRLGTDLNIGPAHYTMFSHFFNDDYPRKEIKAPSTIVLKSQKWPGGRSKVCGQSLSVEHDEDVSFEFKKI